MMMTNQKKRKEKKENIVKTRDASRCHFVTKVSGADPKCLVRIQIPGLSPQQKVYKQTVPEPINYAMNKYQLQY